MPSITIKNLPDTLHHALKSRAKEHGRSLNGEILTCLKAAVSVTRVSVPETLAAIDSVRTANSVQHDPSLVEEALKESRR